MTATARTVPKQLTPWRPGQSGNPAGRPRGSRNKLGENFINDLYLHWQANGAAVIERVCQERPQDYLKVVASVLPKEIHAKKDATFEDMTDDELMDALNDVRSFLAMVGGGTDKGGCDTAEDGEASH